MMGALTMAVAYRSFLLAEIVHVSGVMSTLLAAIAMSSSRLSEEVNQSNKELWDVDSYRGGNSRKSIECIFWDVFDLSGNERPGRYKRADSHAVGQLKRHGDIGISTVVAETLEYWWTIQAIAFGVVVFTLFVQASTIKFLVEMLGVENDRIEKISASKG